MKRILNKYIIPHVGNDHKPHLLRETGVLVLSYIIVLAFFGSLLQSRLISSPQFTAEVLPGVLVDLANDSRADNQLAALTINQTLVTSAELKAQDMAAGQYFAHINPSDPSKTPWHWFYEAGYSFQAAGENLAIDFSDSGSVNRAWMNSPTHRANLLNTKFTEIGISIESGSYEGRPTTYVVQHFGKPRQIAAAPAPVVPAQIPTPAPAPAPQPAPVQVVTINSNPTPAPAPEPQPAVAGTEEKQVAGDSAEPVTPELVTIVEDAESEDEKFVAVEIVSSGTPELITDAPSNPSMEEAPKYSTWYERLLASPKRTLEYSYIALSGLILVVILLMINKEIERHHLKHIFYGLALLVLMYLLLSASKAILLNEVIVK